MTKTNNEGIQPGFWIGLALVVLLFLGVRKCHAKSVYDTIPCRTECIQKFIEQPTKGGKQKIFAVYVDEKHNVLDIISVSTSVYDYIQLCKQNRVEPSLGIKLKDGQIYSIIKFKRRYVKKDFQ